MTLARSFSACEGESLDRIRQVVQSDPALSKCQILKDRRVIERAVLVASEVLGADCYLTSKQLKEKSKYHLLMSVQMTLDWLVDETLDPRPDICRDVVAEIIRVCTDGLESEGKLRFCMRSLRATSARNEVPEPFVEALPLLVTWQRNLAESVGIATSPMSLYSGLNREFIGTFLKCHDRFDSWQIYERHRAANNGLTLEVLCGAYWLCRRLGIDQSVLEQYRDKYSAIIQRYGLIGGVSNDLFGYDKDIEETVGTSVEVARLCLPKGAEDDEEHTFKAFAWTIRFHNQRLEELVDRIRSCRDATEIAVLLSALRATWAVRVLHQEFKTIYEQGWLNRALSQIPPSGFITR